MSLVILNKAYLLIAIPRNPIKKRANKGAIVLRKFSEIEAFSKVKKRINRNNCTKIFTLNEGRYNCKKITIIKSVV